MRPTISLCVIARDEEKNLESCLHPVKPLVDEIIVVDTGSTDRSREIARHWGAKVFDFAWVDDFAAARNEGLCHATGDFVLWLDADDRLDAENLERLAAIKERLADEGADVYLARVLSPVATSTSAGSWVTHARLFRRSAALHWTRRVHEELVPEDDQTRLNVRWTDLVIRHVGYQDPSVWKRKLERNMRLLQLDFVVDPDDPFTLFYLGWSYLELGRLPQALRFFKRSLPRNPNPRKLYFLLGETLRRQNQPSEALEVCNQGLVRFPDDPELLLLRASLLAVTGDVVGAEQTLVKLINLPPQTYAQIGVEDGLQGQKARFMLGLLYDELGRWDEAELQFRTAIRENPRSTQAWLGLCQLYVAARFWDGLGHALAELRQCPGGDPLASVLEARSLIAQQQYGPARRLLEEVIAQDPRALWPRLVLSDLAMRGGVDHQTAVEIHREILDLDPANPVGRERLAVLLGAPVPAAAPAAPQQAPPPPGWAVIVGG